MLDFNRKYYDELCNLGRPIPDRYDFKPGKYDNSGYYLRLPKTFRIEESDADEKRSGPCRRKTTKEILNSK